MKTYKAKDVQLYLPRHQSKCDYQRSALFNASLLAEPAISPACLHLLSLLCADIQEAPHFVGLVIAILT